MNKRVKIVLFLAILVAVVISVFIFQPVFSSAGEFANWYSPLDGIVEGLYYEECYPWNCVADTWNYPLSILLFETWNLNDPSYDGSWGATGSYPLLENMFQRKNIIPPTHYGFQVRLALKFWESVASREARGVDYAHSIDHNEKTIAFGIVLNNPFQKDILSAGIFYHHPSKIGAEVQK